MRDLNRYEKHAIHHTAQIRYFSTHDLPRTQYVLPVLLHRTGLRTLHSTAQYSRLNLDFLIIDIIFQTDHDVKTRLLLLLFPRLRLSYNEMVRKLDRKKKVKHVIYNRRSGTDKSRT